MILDRTLQREILEGLSAVYPETVDFQSRPDFAEQKFQANLFYLQEHGLIDGQESNALNSARFFNHATCRGGRDIAPSLLFLIAADSCVISSWIREAKSLFIRIEVVPC